MIEGLQQFWVGGQLLLTSALVPRCRTTAEDGGAYQDVAAI
jgi:hypothetical protein